MTGAEFQMSFHRRWSFQPSLFTGLYEVSRPSSPTALLTKVWSRMHRFGFKLTTKQNSCQKGREGDRYRWFMSTVGELGLNKEECRINNLVVNIIRKIPLPEKNSQEKLNCWTVVVIWWQKRNYWKLIFRTQDIGHAILNRLCYLLMNTKLPQNLAQPSGMLLC